MNSEKKLRIFLIFLIVAKLNYAQTGRICSWRNDKKAAVVLTFDDWSPGHYPAVIPALNVRGLPATFFLITNNVAPWNHNWPEVNIAVNAGHEMGNHTQSHPYLSSLDETGLHNEISLSKQIIDSNTGGNKTLCFAYPYGVGAGLNQKDVQIRDSIKASGHICARSIDPIFAQYYTYDFAMMPDDYYKIKTFSMNASITINNFTNEIQKISMGGGLLTYLYHSVDNASGSYNDNWYARILIDSLKRQLDTLAIKQNKVWVTTLGSAVKYHREKKCAALAEIQAPNGSVWIVNLSDTLSDNAVFNEPLTLKLKCNGVFYTSVMQNGLPINYTMQGDTIVFDAVPDKGYITLSVDPLGIKSPAGSFSLKLFPNPVIDVLTIIMEPTGSFTSICVEDISGRKFFERFSLNTNSAQVDLKNMNSGMYLVKIKCGEQMVVRKFIIP